ncbi:hypothetical protein SDC9_146046 [bioreactor metagenome]|uniref:Uncharacterized protein n=1 Tax=bioreactor metagenome TaxID=1076179 RepID=A0A645EB12_9ZZZZ
MRFGHNAINTSAKSGNWDVVVTVKTGDFFGDVGLVFEISTPGGNCNVVPLYSAANGLKCPNHIRMGYSDADKAVDPVGVQLDGLRRFYGIIDINRTVDRLTRAKQDCQFTGTVGGSAADGGI